MRPQTGRVQVYSESSPIGQTLRKFLVAVPKFACVCTMSLAEASEARKARLIALRKRKAGETVDRYAFIASDLHLVV